jgi:HEAT repeat protein
MHTRSHRLPLAALFLLAACPMLWAASSKYPDENPPHRDLLKEVDFERHGDYALGPIGARGWMDVRHFMTTDARQILITAVAPGSPADGVLQDGDVVLGVNGKAFDRDARKVLAAAIEDAEREANAGKLSLIRWRPNAAPPRSGKTENIALQLPVMGGYSDTAPFECAKSAKIYANALAVLDKSENMGRLKALAFLATGEEKHIKRVGDYLHSERWAKPDVKIEVDGGGKKTWGAGFHLLIMCEYYLLTKDDYVLASIREHAVSAAMGQAGSGTWGHTFALPSYNDGKLHGALKGYGSLNLPALHTFAGMLLAQECGVSDPELTAAIERCRVFFGQFVDHGSVSYGQHRPSLEHENNGRNALGSNGKNALAGLAFTLGRDKHASQYFSKLVASSYDDYEYGHGGNSFNVFWRAVGAAQGGPANLAAFQKELRWYNTLTRQHDGSFVHQKLGGYYGGETLNVTAAQVLANSIPKQTLRITGRDADTDFWLSDTEVADAIAAGRWRRADYSTITTAELLEALDSWSPSAREYIAKALAKKPDNVVPQLVEMLSSRDADRRSGAAAALGYQGQRAKSAVPALMKALQDRESTVRVSASYAISRIGEPANKVLPEMLQAVLALDEQSPVQPTTMALAYSIGFKQGRTAPLYFTGLLGDVATGADPLGGVDRELLYDALRKLAANPNGRIAGTGLKALEYCDRTDLARLAQLLQDCVNARPRDHAMFRDAPRAAAISAMARHKLADGMELAISTFDFQEWGAVMRVPHRLGVIESYGGHAKPLLPQLKQLRWKYSGGDNREALEDAIRTIEGAPDAKGELITLQQLVNAQLAKDIGINSYPPAHIRKLREMQKKYADNGPYQIAVLGQLAAAKDLKDDDIADAIVHRNPALQQAAVDLAPSELGWLTVRRLKKRLNQTDNSGERDAIVKLFAKVGKSELAILYLPDTIAQALTPHPPALIAAIADGDESARREALEILGTAKDPGLFGLLKLQIGDEENRQRHRFAQLLLQRVVCEIEPLSRRAEAMALIAIGADSNTARRTIEEIKRMPRDEAIRYLQPYLKMTDRRYGDAAKRAAEALNALGE